MKKLFILLSLSLLLPLVAHAAEQGGEKQQIMQIGVQGMSCKFCARSVEKNLMKLDGVEKASVDLDAGQAVVTLKPGGKVDVKSLNEQITAAGFTPGEVEVRQ